MIENIKQVIKNMNEKKIRDLNILATLGIMSDPRRLELYISPDYRQKINVFNILNANLHE